MARPFLGALNAGIDFHNIARSDRDTGSQPILVLEVSTMRPITKKEQDQVYGAGGKGRRRRRRRGGGGGSSSGGGGKYSGGGSSSGGGGGKYGGGSSS